MHYPGFHENCSLGLEFAKMSMIRLMAVGDVFLQTRNNRNPFSGVEDLLKDKDILFGNLETVLLNRGREREKAVLLYTSSHKVEYLKEAGFDILNVANNHILDLGIEGFKETLDVLARNELRFIGVSDPLSGRPYEIVEKQKMKFGFAGFYPGGSRYPRRTISVGKEEEIIHNIKRMRCPPGVMPYLTPTRHRAVKQGLKQCPSYNMPARSLLRRVIGNLRHPVNNIGFDVIGKGFKVED